MRHLWPWLCGSSAGKPGGGTQSITTGVVEPSGGVGTPIFCTLKVLAGLFGAIASEGLPTHSSMSVFSSNGDVQPLGAVLRRNCTVTVLVWPGSALSGPETGPTSLMSGLSHHTPPALCAPPSPATASMKKHVSAARPGSFAISDSFQVWGFARTRGARAVAYLTASSARFA